MSVRPRRCSRRAAARLNHRISAAGFSMTTPSAIAAVELRSSRSNCSMRRLWYCLRRNSRPISPMTSPQAPPASGARSTRSRRSHWRTRSSMYCWRASIAASTRATVSAGWPISSPARRAVPASTDARTNGPPQEGKLIGSGSTRGRASGLYPRGKAVAGPAHRLDILVTVIAFERLAEPADVHVDGAFFHVDVASPHAIEQLLATVYTVGVQHEELQQPVLGRSQGHGPARGTHPGAGAIVQQAAGDDRLGFVLASGSTQQGIDSRQQLAR